jgi:hypothetical protein
VPERAAGQQQARQQAAQQKSGGRETDGEPAAALVHADREQGGEQQVEHRLAGGSPEHVDDVGAAQQVTEHERVRVGGWRTGRAFLELSGTAGGRGGSDISM